MNGLLSPTVFPVGFSKGAATAAKKPPARTTTAAAWKHQIALALEKAEPKFNNLCFRLMDRLLLEAKQGNLSTSNSVATTVSADRLNWILRDWKNNLLLASHNRSGVDENDEWSPEKVYERVAEYSSFGIAQRNGKTLSLLVHAISLIENDPAKAYDRATRLVQRSLEDLKSSGGTVQSAEHPNASTIDNLLSLLHRSGLPDAPKAADWLLAQLKQWFDASSKRPNMRPTNLTYATTVAIWTAASSDDGTTTNAEAAARRAESILIECEKASTDHSLSPNLLLLYGTIIDAISKVGRAERAHELLERWILMQLEEAESTQTSSTTQELRLSLLGPFSDGDYATSCRTPSSSSWELSTNPVASVLGAYGMRIGQEPNEFIKMESLIRRMEDLSSSLDQKFLCLRPGRDCYYHLISAYATLKRPQQAETCLRQLLSREENFGKAHADQGSCLSLAKLWAPILEAWSKNRDRLTVPKATGIIQALENSSKKDLSCRPDVQMYNVLLHCYANDCRNSSSQNAVQTQELLGMLECGWCVGPDGKSFPVSCKPEEFSYTTALRAWCRAGHPDRAELLLRGLYEEDDDDDETPASRKIFTTVPVVHHFEMVMEAWTYANRGSKEYGQSVQKVAQLLVDMQEMYVSKGMHTKPTKSAYNIFLKCQAYSSSSGIDTSVIINGNMLNQIKRIGLSLDDPASATP